jgi:hypothetical protein
MGNYWLQPEFSQPLRGLNMNMLSAFLVTVEEKTVASNAHDGWRHGKSLAYSGNICNKNSPVPPPSFWTEQEMNKGTLHGLLPKASRAITVKTRDIAGLVLLRIRSTCMMHKARITADPGFSYLSRLT